MPKNNNGNKKFAMNYASGVFYLNLRWPISERVIRRIFWTIMVVAVIVMTAILAPTGSQEAAQAAPEFLKAMTGSKLA